MDEFVFMTKKPKRDRVVHIIRAESEREAYYKLLDSGIFPEEIIGVQDFFGDWVFKSENGRCRWYMSDGWCD